MTSINISDQSYSHSKKKCDATVSKINQTIDRNHISDIQLTKTTSKLPLPVGDLSPHITRGFWAQSYAPQQASRLHQAFL